MFTKPPWERAKALLFGAPLPSWQTCGHGLVAFPDSKSGNLSNGVVDAT